MPPKSHPKRPRKAANGYRLPDPIPEGTIIQGQGKKSWKIGKSIGVGGFGEIYLGSKEEEVGKKGKKEEEMVRGEREK